MTQLPIVDFRTMEKLLFRLGFYRVRSRGSHFFYRHPDGRTTAVPFHSGIDLTRPLIRVIIREIKLTPEQYVNLLESL